MVCGEVRGGEIPCYGPIYHNNLCNHNRGQDTFFWCLLLDSPRNVEHLPGPRN